MKPIFIFIFSAIFLMNVGLAQVNFQLSPSGNSHLHWPFLNSSYTSHTCSPDGPWSCGTGGWHVECGPNCGFHRGSDYYADDWNITGSADCGADFLSPLSGTVIYVGWINGYGNQVVVRSNINSNFAFRVTHLESNSVANGQSVSVGTKLGDVGTTGNSSGCHAHCVLYKNITQNYGSNTALSILQQGGYLGTSGSPNTFAAPFYFDATTAGSTTPTLTVSPSSRSVTNSSGSTTFGVTSTTTWSATDNVPWLWLSPTGLSGSGTLTASYYANTGAARTATITISGGGITRTVTVSQAAGSSTATLTVSPTSLSTSATAAVNSVNLTTTCASWSVSGVPFWLSISPTSGSGNRTLSVTQATNTNPTARSATITVSGCGISRSFTVTQAGATGGGGGTTLANDNPCGAFNLPIVSSWSYTNGTNVGATTTTNPGPTTSCTFYGSDVWYSFVASSTTMTIQVGQTGTATDLMMALYSGNCSSLAGLTCDDDNGPGNMPKIVRSGLTVGARYYVRVWGYGGQTGTFGIAVRAGSYLNDDTGINSFTGNTGNTERSTDLKVYPNPTRGMISLSNLSENGQLTVTNLFGQVVKHTQVNTTDTSLDISDLPGGFYFINYFDGTLSSVVKIELIK